MYNEMLGGFYPWASEAKVCLYYAGPCFIVPFKTGVTYYNQTGCVCCNQQEVEGFMIPVKERELTLVRAGCVCSNDYWTSQAVQERFQEMLEDALRSVGLTYVSHFYEEAWTTVRVATGRTDYTDGTEFDVILSWENCD